MVAAFVLIYIYIYNVAKRLNVEINVHSWHSQLKMCRFPFHIHNNNNTYLSGVRAREPFWRRQEKRSYDKTIRHTVKPNLEWPIVYYSHFFLPFTPESQAPWIPKTNGLGPYNTSRFDICHIIQQILKFIPLARFLSSLLIICWCGRPERGRRAERKEGKLAGSGPSHRDVDARALWIYTYEHPAPGVLLRV